MLFSPSMHQVMQGEKVTVSGTADRIVYYDPSVGRGVRARAAEHAQEETYIFSLIGLTSDSMLVLQNFTISTTAAVLDISWPFAFTCSGIKLGVSARANAGTAAGLNVYRNSNSVFDNAAFSGTATGAFCQIATGTVVAGSGIPIVSTETAPNAAHVSWSAGDRIRCFVTQGAVGVTNPARFHGPKLYIRGARL